MEIGNVEDALGILKIKRIIKQSPWYLKNFR